MMDYRTFGTSLALKILCEEIFDEHKDYPRLEVNVKRRLDKFNKTLKRINVNITDDTLKKRTLTWLLKEAQLNVNSGTLPKKVKEFILTHFRTKYRISLKEIIKKEI